jgi:diguanylate cyclase (GGDEF)-like protein
MRFRGRIIGSLGMFLLHSIYILYYYYRDLKVESFDLYSYPLLVLIGYWAGKQFDKATFYSEKDELTGIYNRRFVMSSFEKITNLAERVNSKLFVLIIDCDNFKTINDKFGHLNGDLVLSKISETLVESTRKSDIIARWGGDEFLLIGHLKEETDLIRVLNRIEKNLRVLSADLEMPVDASIGSAIYPNHSKNLLDLIRIADNNMYKVKYSKEDTKVTKHILEQI